MRLVLGLIWALVPSLASAQNAVLPMVRHRLEGAIVLGGPEAHAQAATLKLKVQISDHATDADFFGVVAHDFALAASDGGRAPVTTLWQDPACHTDRGLPKISILSLAGTVAGDGGIQGVDAVPRRLGKLMPSDEIAVRGISAGVDRARRAEAPAISVKAIAKRSQIGITLDLFVENCEAAR